MEIPSKVAAGFLSLGRVPYTGPLSSFPYSPKCLEEEFSEFRSSKLRLLGSENGQNSDELSERLR